MPSKITFIKSFYSCSELFRYTPTTISNFDIYTFLRIFRSLKLSRIYINLKPLVVTYKESVFDQIKDYQYVELFEMFENLTFMYCICLNKGFQSLFCYLIRSYGLFPTLTLVTDSHTRCQKLRCPI